MTAVRAEQSEGVGDSQQGYGSTSPAPGDQSFKAGRGRGAGGPQGGHLGQSARLNQDATISQNS